MVKFVRFKFSYVMQALLNSEMWSKPDKYSRFYPVTRIYHGLTIKNNKQYFKQS